MKEPINVSYANAEYRFVFTPHDTLLVNPHTSAKLGPIGSVRVAIDQRRNENGTYTIPDNSGVLQETPMTRAEFSSLKGKNYKQHAERLVRFED